MTTPTDSGTPAPAVPDDVAATLCATTAEMAAACSVPMEQWDRHSNAALAACATIEAQAAELARIKAAADNLVNNPGWGTVNYTDGDMWADADKLRAALTHPTGERT